MHREKRIRRDDVHVVGLHRLSRNGQRHGHRGFLRQNLREQALVLRVQVLHDDEGHAGCRKGTKKLDQRFEASRRGANSHHEHGRLATGVCHGSSIGHGDGYNRRRTACGPRVFGSTRRERASFFWRVSRSQNARSHDAAHSILAIRQTRCCA